MKVVFADAVYWIALVKPRDPWREAALMARLRLGGALVVTSDEVLTEFLAALSKSGPSLRLAAVRMVREILADTRVQVVAQSRASFEKGLDLYETRLDKQFWWINQHEFGEKWGKGSCP